MPRSGVPGQSGLHQRGSTKPSPVKSHPLAVKSYPLELGAHQPGDETDLAMLAHAATGPGIVIPSSLAFYALLAVPAAIWVGCLVSGMLMFEGLPGNKRDVQHLMLWFDVAIFRTLAGV